MSTRILDGVRFTRQDNGVWISEDKDGRFRIESDEDNITECENEHPVRITPAIVKSVREQTRLWCQAARFAVADGQRGYLCPGGQEHNYTTWHVWDDEKGDFVGGDSGFPSFTAAAKHFVRWHQSIGLDQS